MAARKVTLKLASQTSTRTVIPQSLGGAMLSLWRGLWETFEAKQNSAETDDYTEYDAAYEVMRTISSVRPVTAVDALAQIIFLYDEAGDIDQANTWDEKRCKEWSGRMARRAAGLAVWIERNHGIDRRDYGLIQLCTDQLGSNHFPHAPAETWHLSPATK